MGTKYTTEMVLVNSPVIIFKKIFLRILLYLLTSIILTKHVLYASVLFFTVFVTTIL